MAPTSAWTRPGRLVVLVVLAAGCTSTPAPQTGVSHGTAPQPSPPPSTSPRDPASTEPGALPAPPDLSGNIIDCDAVDGPCDHGDDPDLDRLWDACADGAGGACDRLYYDSGFDTRYEQFGNTCGDRGLLIPCPPRLEP